MVVVRKTKSFSYVVAELDGTESQLRVAGFRLIPYFPRMTSSIPVVTDVTDDDDATFEDPEDVRYLQSLPPAERSYHSAPIPSF